jgi:biotin-(acetyl-CoA carboxylase) ligase
MSVLLRPGDDPAPRHACVLAVALAAADACAAVSGVEPGLKWPNDLVVDDLKLAGILAEVIAADAIAADAIAADAIAAEGGPGASGGAAVVVGLGVNVGWPPSKGSGETEGSGETQGSGETESSGETEGSGETGSSEESEVPESAAQRVAAQEVLGKATSLARLSDAPVDPDLLLAEVLEHLGRRITDLLVPIDTQLQRLDLQPQAQQALIEEYRKRCVTLNRRVRVEEPSGSFTGVAADVTGEGHLVVETPSGRRVVLAGDVVHLHHA